MAGEVVVFVAKLKQFKTFHELGYKVIVFVKVKMDYKLTNKQADTL